MRYPKTHSLDARVRRNQAYEMRKEGATLCSIAEILGVCHNTVVRWIEIAAQEKEMKEYELEPGLTFYDFMLLGDVPRTAMYRCFTGLLRQRMKKTHVSRHR